MPYACASPADTCSKLSMRAQAHHSQTPLSRCTTLPIVRTDILAAAIAAAIAGLQEGGGFRLVGQLRSSWADLMASRIWT